MYAVEISNISKRYRIGRQAEYATLRDSIASGANKILKRERRTTVEDFWALKDISFTIPQGQRIGIIGRNGAGKSTLLKIISRITAPTTGDIKLHGRVASLLEVGTGFHPELSGRENIFLNGAILGMTRREILKKFDEIVAFSEIEKFLDTPVKRYSSGMYVRLAFAVAAHLVSNILIVDEVLAVGDAQFQKKCLGKMQDVAGQGRTILFVSHNMAAINQLCDRAILLSAGKIVADGEPQAIITDYFSQANAQPKIIDLTSASIRRNSLEESGVKWRSIALQNSRHVATDHLGFGESFSLILDVDVTKSTTDARLAFAVQSALGFALFNSFQDESGLPTSFEPGRYRFTAKVENNPFAPGLYEISLGANGPSVTDWIPTAMQFTISTVSTDGHHEWGGHKGGTMIHPVTWSVTKS